MRTISNREFVANPEMYFGMAREQDVRIRKGREIFHLVYEPPVPPQPILEPDDDLCRAISAEEFREKLVEAMKRVDEKYARR